MELKMARSVQARRRREQSVLKEKRPGAEVGVERGGDHTAEVETNIHTNLHEEGQEVTAGTDIAATGGVLDHPTEERNILGGDIPGPGQDLGGETERLKLRTDITG